MPVHLLFEKWDGFDPGRDFVKAFKGVIILYNGRHGSLIRILNISAIKGGAKALVLFFNLDQLTAAIVNRDVVLSDFQSQRVVFFDGLEKAVDPKLEIVLQREHKGGRKSASVCQFFFSCNGSTLFDRLALFSNQGA